MCEYNCDKTMFFHERARHIEVDGHFICEKVVAKKIQLTHSPNKDQLADFLTKAVTKNQLSCVLTKLGMVNIYPPA